MQYRREIDGLRALAVIPVLLFHGGFGLFGGGYVGVDVFFVISGYLITTIILEAKAQERFSIAKFYERRARRILPALFLVVLCSAVVGWFWLLPLDFEEFSKSVSYVSLFLSNVFFYKQSGYFDTAAELKPLLHTWSLAVEEQYYVLFPLLIGFLCKVRRSAIPHVLVLLGGASLVYAELTVSIRPAAAFYLLPARFWELMLGSLVAWLVFSGGMKVRANNSLGIIGVALIVVPMVSYGADTVFPGLTAVPPVFGAALIILFATPETLVGRVLSSKPFVGIGLISYSAYLWHQPLLAFARYRAVGEMALWVTGVLLSMALCLAYLSWRFVETPMRRRIRSGRTRPALLVAALGSVAFYVAGSAGKLADGFPSRFAEFSVIASDFTDNRVRAECDRGYDKNDPRIAFCTIGSKAGAREEVVVFGDSHSTSLLPAFDAIGKEESLAITHIGLGGCPPLLEVDVPRGKFGPGACADLARREFEYVRVNGIRTVFLVARWSLYFGGDVDGAGKYRLVPIGREGLAIDDDRLALRFALEATIRAYEEIGAKVYLIQQVPQQWQDPKRVYSGIVQRESLGTAEVAAKVRDASIRMQQHLALQASSRAIIADVAARSRLGVVELDPAFCVDGVCLMGSATNSYYQDSDHVNVNGAMRTVEILRGVIATR